MKFPIRILAFLLSLCLLAGCSGAASGTSSQPAPGASSSAPSAGAPSSLPAADADSASAPDGAASGADAAESAGQRYALILRDARTAEDNEYLELVYGDAESAPAFVGNPNELSDEQAAESINMMLQTMGLDGETLDAYAFSMSMMNVRAYAVGIFLPAEGQADAVMAALEEYVSLQQQAFEQYLEDQYTVAKGALLRTLPSGEIVLIMCDGAPDVMAAVEKALA